MRSRPKQRSHSFRALPASKTSSVAAGELFLNFNKIGGFGLHNFVYSAGKLSINVLDSSLIRRWRWWYLVLVRYKATNLHILSRYDMRILIDKSK